MAIVDATRRALLRGRPKARPPLTPPWAIPYDEFTDRCTRCGDCLGACPQTILARGDGGFPTVNFAAGDCTFCRACVRACTTGALRADVNPPWRHTAHITDACLTLQGVYCQNCRDSCAVHAIAFSPQVGRVPQPRIHASACTGCGACVSACPTMALDIINIDTESIA